MICLRAGAVPPPKIPEWLGTTFFCDRCGGHYKLDEEDKVAFICRENNISTYGTPPCPTPDFKIGGQLVTCGEVNILKFNKHGRLIWTSARGNVTEPQPNHGERVARH